MRCYYTCTYLFCTSIIQLNLYNNIKHCNWKWSDCLFDIFWKQLQVNSKQYLQSLKWIIRDIWLCLFCIQISDWLWLSIIDPVADPEGNRGNVPPPNPENLQRMGNSPRLSQQWKSIVEKFSNFVKFFQIFIKIFLKTFKIFN